MSEDDVSEEDEMEDDAEEAEDEDEDEESPTIGSSKVRVPTRICSALGRTYVRNTITRTKTVCARASP